jgi:hypothetical protein
LKYSGGVRIGALSIRGPARSIFTAQEADILRQMTEWAVGEIELIASKRELELRESIQIAKSRITGLEKMKGWNKHAGGLLMQQVRYCFLL